MFQEIKLSKGFDKYHCTSQYEVENVIDCLSRINVFVGSNNSGKSRLLRNLFVNNDYSFLHFKTSKEEFDKASSDFLKLIVNNFKKSGYYYVNDLENIYNSIKKVLPKLIYWNIAHGKPGAAIDICRQELSQVLTKIPLSSGRSHASLANITNWFEQDANIKRYKEKLISDYFQQEINPQRYYIPTLRSLKGLSPKAEMGYHSFDDVYRKHTVEEYFKGNGNSDDLNIFTGLTLYEDVTRLLLGNTTDRNKIKEFEQFIQDAFFEQEVNIVPHLDSRTLHIKIGNKEHPIHERGDGIQSIILLTYQLFMNRGRNVIFFFEEPETHLHPGYQRLFLETLLDKRFESYQYFMTTHSNHFLDITLDYDKISVYSFHRHKDEDEFDVENVTSGDENILKLIGARTSSVFLSNCTIWVEGITDRIYIRKFLEIIQSNKPMKFREDYHFSFVEYAGNNITHWSFLDSEDLDHPNINVERLCSKLFLITDNDGAGFTINGQPNIAKPKKYERHQKLHKKLGDRYYLLKCREIENLLKKETIEQVIRSNEPKNDTLDFSRFYKATKYKDVQLGKFIEDKVTGLKKKYRYRKTEALNLKPDFAKSAVEHIKTKDDLSDEAKKLAERLYDFIRLNNT